MYSFIGDGMGMPQVNAAEIFKGTLESENKMHKRQTWFYSISQIKVCKPLIRTILSSPNRQQPERLWLPDKTNNDILGMDATKTVKLKTMAEMAKEKGMKVGIVSNVSIDHAYSGRLLCL